MVFEHIEKLQREYTDKLVVVDASRPELARFRDATGVVRTINMNGRALVEFDQYANIAWYDIELDFLRVVDQPQPKPEKKVAAAKAPAAKAPVAKAPAGAKPAAAGAQPGKMSVAEILAAARGKAGAGAAPANPGEAKPKPTAAKSAAAKPAAKGEAKPGKMSTADILAAARAKKAPTVESESVAEEDTADELVETPIAKTKTTPPAKSKTAASDSLPSTTAEKISWCRDHDTQ